MVALYREPPSARAVITEQDIAMLQAEIATLRARIAELESQLTSRNAQMRKIGKALNPMAGSLLWDDIARGAVERIAELEARQVPEGWKAVPKEPTPEMIEAFKARYKEGDFWRERLHGAIVALLAAAPSPADSGEEKQ